MNNDENKNDKKTEGDDYVFDFGREEKNDGQAGRETRVPPEVYEQRGNIPGEVGSEKNAKRKKTNGWKIAACCIGALAIAGAGFLGGYYAYRGSLDSEMRSLIWAKDKIQSDYYEDISDNEFYDAIFDAVNGLLDPYSAYLTADEYAEMLDEATGMWSGLGVTFSSSVSEENQPLLIIRVSGNSPAEAAGIRAGMCVLGFGLTKEEVRDANSYDELSAFLSERKTGEKFVLKLKDGEEILFKEVSKEAFIENYVFYRSDDSAYIFTGDDADILTESQNFLPLDEETAYIRLTQFNGQAYYQFASAMNIFKKDGKQNLILDLRANGGGYLNILCNIASYFCKTSTDKNPAVAVADYTKKGKKEVFEASGNYYYDYFSDESCIYVLADSGTASASECLIGCMVDYGAVSYSDIFLSERNGIAKTYGKGIMQTTVPSSIFGRPDAIKLTTARILWPLSGNCIHDRGVLPEDGAHVVSENYSEDAEILEAWEIISAQK